MRRHCMQGRKALGRKREEYNAERVSLPTKMSIGRSRVAPPVRALLCVAVLMSLAGALGLHPEPDFAIDSLSSGPDRNWTQASAHAVPSDCPICLSHRPISLAGLFGVLLEPGAYRAVAVRPEPISPSVSVPRRHEGRAPPAV